MLSTPLVYRDMILSESVESPITVLLTWGMAKESIEKQREPYRAIVALDKTALPLIASMGVEAAYKQALRQHAALFPPPPERKEFQVGMFEG